jgi:hypothetical protein
MVRMNTSDEEVDLSILQKMEVIKNHLKMSICMSLLLFACLVIPYFLKWYSEPSSITGADLYFGLNHVWVPVKALIPDEATGNLISEVSYTRMKLSTFLVSGCPTSTLPLEKCESYNGLQFASFCYLPLKLISQLFHLWNILNALKEIVTVRGQRDIYKIHQDVKRAGLGEFSLDCRSSS